MNVQIKISYKSDILELMRELNTANTCRVLSGNKAGDCIKCCFKFEGETSCLLDEMIDRLELK